MTPEAFVYWLQGALELGNVKQLNEAQVVMIKQHLALVLTETASKIATLPLPEQTRTSWSVEHLKC